MKDLHILAVDDEESNLLLLRRTLEREGYQRITATTDPTAVVGMVDAERPSLILLDLHMPGLDGFAVMAELHRRFEDAHEVPVLVLTADATDETKRRALAAGARDFLTKPLDRIELLLRVRSLLAVEHLQERLRGHRVRLEQEVAERTRDLDEARQEVLDRLALAGEYRDDDTQEHARRIGRSCARIADGLGLSAEEAGLIERAAPLHDIGKIGISDLILLKPGKLTDAEFATVRTHTTLGAQILAGSRSPVLQLAETIALTHHERWDGRGYPRGLEREEIPLAGRIAAVADVFDALSFKRPYKRAWPLEEAVAEIVEQAGSQFDPEVVTAFRTLDHAALLVPLGR